MMTRQDLFRQLTDLTLQLQKEPDNAELLMQRGQIRYRLNDKPGAWEDLQDAYSSSSFFDRNSLYSF